MSNNVSAHYIMRKEPEAGVDCGISQGGGGGYPYLDLGGTVGILPTMAQLIQIRDAINTCLETPEAQALLPVTLRTVKPRVTPRLGLDVANLILALDVSTSKLRVIAQSSGSDFSDSLFPLIDNNLQLLAQFREAHGLARGEGQ